MPIPHIHNRLKSYLLPSKRIMFL
ncbi:hypothetical protein RHIZ404_230650 [Rhizobium sp. EC-SD404]|nr:hypothetical protein RHIZ404_230650 [Rhizobium sp. EC-SD404]